MSALSNAHPGQICRDVFHVEQNLRRLCFTWNKNSDLSVDPRRSFHVEHFAVSEQGTVSKFERFKPGHVSNE